MKVALTDVEIDRIIEMAWEDKTPFEAIFFQFGLREKDVLHLMRYYLKKKSFENWRKRVSRGNSNKHLKLRETHIERFKSKMQKVICLNKISKR